MLLATLMRQGRELFVDKQRSEERRRAVGGGSGEHEEELG